MLYPVGTINFVPFWHMYFGINEEWKPRHSDRSERGQHILCTLLFYYMSIKFAPQDPIITFQRVNFMNVSIATTNLQLQQAL